MNQAGIDICEKVWIPALESGEYAQGWGFLRTYKNTFCCLGVLCDKLDPHAWREHALSYSWKKTLYDTPMVGMLPHDTASRFEFSASFLYSLVSLNDVGKAVFPVIANAIRAEVAAAKEALLEK